MRIGNWEVKEINDTLVISGLSEEEKDFVRKAKKNYIENGDDFEQKIFLKLPILFQSTYLNASFHLTDEGNLILK